MVNKVAYKSYPDESEFTSLYKTHTQHELSKIYGCNTQRIRKWIKHFNLESRPQGGGNNRKYNLSKEELQNYISSGLTNEDISRATGMSGSNVNRYLRKYGIKRNYNTQEYTAYARKVRYLTEYNYAKYKEAINPNGFARTLCGVEKGYQLDHVVSIRDCFDAGFSVEECARRENLQMIPWEENLRKRKYKKRIIDS